MYPVSFMYPVLCKAYLVLGYPPIWTACLK